MRDPVDDDLVVTILRRYDGELVQVQLKTGECLEVYDIAWGYDIGDDHAHITTNVSPLKEGRSIDFFYSNEVASITPPNGQAIKIVCMDE